MTSIVNDQLVKVARRVMGTYSLNDDCDRTNLGGLGDPSHWFYFHPLHCTGRSLDQKWQETLR